MSKLKVFFALAIVVSLAFTACSKDDDNNMIVRVNGSAVIENGDDYFGDIDGDFIGDGGSLSKTFSWSNSLGRADYNADITATAEGKFQMIVRDADEAIVLDRSLDGAVEPDSFSGVTSAGTSGIWTVTIVLTDFNGDGSYSLSEGD